MSIVELVADDTRQHCEVRICQQRRAHCGLMRVDWHGEVLALLLGTGRILRGMSRAGY